MPDSATQARELVRIVSSDTSVPGVVRQAALELAPLAGRTPDLALTRLQQLRDKTIPTLPAVSPVVDYVRCVNIEIFWRWNLDPMKKAYFATAEDYRRSVESELTPETRLWADLGGDPLVPAANSWLVPFHALSGLSGSEVKLRLNMGQDPPYAVLVFTLARMLTTGVTVRVPCGLDAVPSRLLQWYPENVPDERIDGDLLRSALDRIEWRP